MPEGSEQTTQNGVGGLRLELVALALGAWCLLAIFALAVVRAGSRLDRLTQTAEPADDVVLESALSELDGMQSRSGKPFFPTSRARLELLAALVELRRFSRSALASPEPIGHRWRPGQG